MVEQDLRKELREVNASLTFINRLYEEMMPEVVAVSMEHNEMHVNTRLQSLCGESVP